QILCRRHRPPFNIRLRDDKSFPYIAVTVEDEYPRVMFTRERHRRGVVYFGPYANAKKVRETLDVLNRVFQYRPCEGPKPGRHSGIPCLDFHIERCHAPCVGNISQADYRAIIDRVIEFLSGDARPIERELERQMKEAASGERLQELADQNARLALESDAFAAETKRLRRVEALEELREALNLESLPIRIECFDVSTIQGGSTVASMVVFEDAVPKKAHYRKFGIRELDGQDDFAAMAEAVSRRFARLSRATDAEYDEGFAECPNLVVIDGGKGQLSAALAAMQQHDLNRVAVIALAKREEEVFVPDRPD